MVAVTVLGCGMSCASLDGLSGTDNGGTEAADAAVSDASEAAFDASSPVDAALDRGTDAPPAPPAPTCSDKLENGAESDVDCGGACAPCAAGMHCSVAADCATAICTNNVCVAPAPTCSDGVQNGGETAIDCGGSSCAPCTGGKGCLGAADCKSGVCAGTTCAVDPFFSSVVLLAHMDGTDGATTFRDEKGHALTAEGAAQIATATSKFGGASALFDQSLRASYVTAATSADWDLTSGDSTVEMWIYAAGQAPSSSMTMLGQSPVTGDQQWSIFFVNPGQLYGQRNGGGGDIGTNSVLLVTTWQHVAVVRDAGTTLLFVDGKQGATGSQSFYTASTNPLYIGITNVSSFGGMYGWRGSIDELRITKGVARYKTDFTPPSTPFPNE